MVRQEEPHTHQTAIIVLDLARGRWSFSGSGRSEAATAHLDAAVTLAASLTDHYARQGFGVRVVDDAGSLLGEVQPEGRGMEALLYTLATVQPEDRNDIAEPSVLKELVQRSRDDVITVITGAWAEADTAMLVARRQGSAHLIATHPDPAAKAPAEALGWSTGRVSRLLGIATPGITTPGTTTPGTEPDERGSRGRS